MALEFRCENCGKLLTVDVDPGNSVRCTHCKKKVRVPDALASLPRPRVAPNAPPVQAGDAQPAVEVEAEELPLPGDDAVMVIMANLMPWVLSVFFHLGLALIMLFVVMIAEKTVAPNVVIPDAVLSDDPGEIMEENQSRESQESKDQAREKQYSRRETAIQADKGKTKKRVRLIGRGGSSGSSDMFGGMTASSGSGPRGSFYGSGGNAYHIVFVIDRSGSMVEVFDEVRMQMQLSIGRLKEVQDFHIILFAEDKTIENPPRRLVYATSQHKLGVVSFLEQDNIRPGGKTTALPALKRAFDVLKNADKRRRGKLVFLLTDGQFAGIGGGSRYRGKVGNEAVIHWLRDNNRTGDVHVNTYLYGDDPIAMQIMRQISRENGGRFKLISGDE